MSGEARLEMLTRLARAGGRDPLLERAPIQSSTRSQADVLAQFANHAAEYRARVVRTSLHNLPDTIQSLLSASGGPLLLPADLPEAWRPPGLEVVRDQGLSTAQLNACSAVLTGCALAVAETGTVVLDHAAAQGRRALTLIPDHHVCVVVGDQVVDSLPEAVARLAGAVRAGRPLTWISGPSATSDIELSRVEGVHGPRRLDIVLVGGA